MQGLTPRQRQVWEFIRSHSATHGYPPSLGEIAVGIGTKSANGAADHVRALERKGYLRRGAGVKSRSWVTLDPDGNFGTPAPTSDASGSLAARLRLAMRGFVIIATRGGRLVTDLAGELAEAIATQGEAL